MQGTFREYGLHNKFIHGNVYDKIRGENRIVGTKNKVGRSLDGKEDVSLMPRWGARVLFESESKIKKNPSNPGLASLTLRKKLIDRLRKRGIVDDNVLNAMAEVERHQFVDSALASMAYEDIALPIGFEQTISQPFVVAKTISIVRQLLSKNRSKVEFCLLYTSDAADE